MLPSTRNSLLSRLPRHSYLAARPHTPSLGPPRRPLSTIEGYEFIPRTEFPFPSNLIKSYFLGHHKAGLSKMKQMVSSVELIIECRDYRVPLSSRNPLFEATLQGRERVIVYTKRDLAADVLDFKVGWFLLPFFSSGFPWGIVDESRVKGRSRVLTTCLCRIGVISTQRFTAPLDIFSSATAQRSNITFHETSRPKKPSENGTNPTKCYSPTAKTSETPKRSSTTHEVSQPPTKHTSIIV